ncbi:MAG: DUF1127 domain-containing protein [Alphaproteobacteria bacterium]|nr:DUF1127 domain-containing protein [Alphaproteobacteria bacterium]
MTVFARNHPVGAVAYGMRDLFRSVVAILTKRRSNRRNVANLRELSDFQLADIGLIPRDPARSSRGRLDDDHSRELARTALISRTFTGIC